MICDGDIISYWGWWSGKGTCSDICETKAINAATKAAQAYTMYDEESDDDPPFPMP
jgi:hypothetical protein